MQAITDRGIPGCCRHSASAGRLEGYVRGFEECKALVVYILLLAEASLLQIPILVISHTLFIIHPARIEGESIDNVYVLGRLWLL